MTAQKTPLWSWNFWRICIINLLVSSFVYMLLPMWPVLMAAERGGDLSALGSAIGCYVFGLFLPGPCSNYLLDRFHRKHVATYAMLLAILLTFAVSASLPIWALAVARVLQGASFALFQISLGNTILIDVTPSEQRTRASQVYYWMSRLGMAVGPGLGLLAWRWHDPGLFAGMVVMIGMVALVLMVRLQVPFRTPLEPKGFSTDRFWMQKAWPLFAVLILLMLSVGLLMADNRSLLFYLLLLSGFLLAVLFHFLMFRTADLRAEVTMGCILIISALMLQLTKSELIDEHATALLVGCGAGLASNSILQFFARISDHCERGTAQSTYFLAWEAGIALGFWLGCMLPTSSPQWVYGLGLCFVFVALLGYLLKVHHWFLAHQRK